MSYPLIPLGQLAKFINGDRGKNYPSKDSFVDIGIPFINAGCLSDLWVLDSSKFNYISEEAYDRLSSGKIQKNDILFCLRGSVGKFAVIRDNNKGALASSLVILRGNDKVDIEYLKHYLASSLCIKELDNYQNGAAQPNLSANDFKKFLVPLPPLAEQRRIASILDQADELRQKRQQAIEKLDQLLQTTFIDMFGDPISNSKKWTEKTLGEVVEFNTGKLDSNSAEENGIYPFFTCSRTPFAINTYAFDIEALLLAGNNAAGQYWVKHYKGKFNAYQRTYVLTIKDSLCTYGYLRYVLQFLLGFLQRMSKGSSTKYLTLSILKPIKIPIPPLELQRKFIQFYENIDSQNQLLIQNEIELNKLFCTLQNQAFNGTL